MVTKHNVCLVGFCPHTHHVHKAGSLSSCGLQVAPVKPQPCRCALGLPVGLSRTAAGYGLSITHHGQGGLPRDSIKAFEEHPHPSKEH